jgi:hypothetical protein
VTLIASINKKFEETATAANARISDVEAKITTLKEEMTKVKNSITTVELQLSGDAPLVTAGVRSDLANVHVQLNAAIEKTVWMRGLICVALVLVFCMQVAILAILCMIWHNGQAPPVEGPVQEAMPNSRIFCKYVPKTYGNGTVVWDGLVSTLSYVSQMNKAAMMALDILTP